MVIQDWIYFAKVAECKSISRAASEMFRTYQGIHKSITQLEKELGEPLFKRDCGELELTRFGEYVLKNIISPMLDYWDASLNSVNLYKKSEDQILRVGIPYERVGIGEKIEMLCRIFRNSYPNIIIERLPLDPRSRLSALLNGDVDIAICEASLFDKRMESILSFQREVVAYVGIDHPLAANDKLSISDLEKASIQVHDLNSPINLKLLDLKVFKRENAVVFDKENPLSKQMLLENRMVRLTLREHQKLYPGMKMLSFDPPIFVYMYLVYLRNVVYKSSLQQFLNFTQQLSNELLEQLEYEE